MVRATFARPSGIGITLGGTRMSLDQLPPAPPLGGERSEGALTPYLRAIREHWLLVLAVTIAAVGASVAWVTLRTPDYEATATILVSPLASDDATLDGIDVLRADPTDSTRTVQTAASLIESADAAALAALRLGSEWTGARVQTAVEVKTQGETNVLAVTATAGDARRAARVANTYTRSALDVRGAATRRQVKRAIERVRSNLASPGVTPAAAVALADRLDRLETVRESGDPAFSVIQRASAPTAPVQTAAVVVVILALIAGLTLGAGAALLIELLDQSVRDDEELRQLYPLPVLVHVPAIRRRQQKALQSLATTPPAVREAFRGLQVQLDRNEQRPRVVMVTSASTGDTKTTTTLNVALALVAAGHRVILIDFDLRKPDIGRAVHVEPLRPLTSLLSGGSLEDMLVEAPQAPTLRVLPADADHDVVLLDALGRELPRVFDEARELADYVIVDTPPLGEISDALRLVDLVDDILVVARIGHTHRGSLKVLRDLMSRTGRTPTGLLVVGASPGAHSSYYQYGGQAARQRSAVAASSSSKG